MTERPHRRSVLALLAGAAGLHPMAVARGQGLGGSGAIGTIRGLAPLIVNAQRIAPAPDVAVRIDGQLASVADLAVGQVARIVGRAEADGLAAAAIDVTSEVVGSVEAAAPGRLIVLGQRVITAGLPGEWRPGTRVAVSGLRRLDGVIVASLVTARGPGLDRVAGPVRRGADGGSMIGNLPLLGGAPLQSGSRALATGSAEGGALRVFEAVPDSRPFPAGLWSVSVEVYLGRAGTALALGSGVPLTGEPGPSLPQVGSVRAIVTASLGPEGGLVLDHLDILERVDHADAALSDLQYEPDRIDLRKLTSPAREPSGRDPNLQRAGSRMLDTRPGGDISRPPDDASLRDADRNPRAGSNGLATGRGAGTRAGPGPNGPTYPGSGGADAPSNIPGFRR
ncbi:hypothetical protein [Methylobacterium aerolatum]|uniref:DUF5666 domain-containing protein n=1 Tax=Methylobacterium aerolatum TaxID=418708 RepID=A0ABU0HVS4_9HYPH|nr:hypothetical protein [Methylobacterium aerolatum]MDQ0446430.1 hypothetical protein [Methylobacterium aerolatum]GJD33407.1 hypothetical protein FMGBMHLM_0294 [Methylobacterium aerolatum]